mgnify:CR=1 FL=1
MNWQVEGRNRWKKRRRSRGREESEAESERRKSGEAHETADRQEQAWRS